MGLAFVVQERPTGLVDAVQRCLIWVEGNAVLQLPDTLFTPQDVVEALAHADLALGLFPTDCFTQLGPVRTERNQVVEILDKPPDTGTFPRRPLPRHWLGTTRSLAELVIP